MSEQQQPVFAIEKIYVKDLSLEIPNAPSIFLERDTPEINLQLGTRNQSIDTGLYEVQLTVTVTAKIKDKIMFLVEAQQAGIFRIQNIPNEEIDPVGNLLIKARLAGDGSDLVVDEIVSDLNKGMLGRSRGEMANIATAENRVGRMAEASGTVEFAKIFMPDLELRLGAAVRGNLETALNDLNSAAKADDAAKSAAAQATITTIFDSYEAALNLTEYDATTETALIDNAVASFKTIGELRAETTINGAAIEAAYAGELQQLTQLVDQVYGSTIDADVSAAIE